MTGQVDEITDDIGRNHPGRHRLGCAEESGGGQRPVALGHCGRHASDQRAGDYSIPAVDTLIMRKDGQGNNLLRLSVTRNVSAHYSEVTTVLAQGHGWQCKNDGKHDRRYTVRDTSVPFYRPPY